MFNINKGYSDSPVDIDSIDGVFIGLFGLQIDEIWTDIIASIFWTPKDRLTHLPTYFGITVIHEKLYYHTAPYFDGLEITCIEADNEEIIYSRSTHDYRVSKDKTCWIEGGREFLYSSVHGRPRQFTIKAGEWVFGMPWTTE
jgi:hypothetical protein